MPEKTSFMAKISSFTAILLIVAAALFTGKMAAQPLTASEAVSRALDKNYSIQLARMNEEILTNNLQAGKLSLLPEANAGLVQSNSITNSNQEYLSGQISEKTGAKAHSTNVSATASWTLFDGGRMFNALRILKKQLAAGQLETRIQVENTIASVLATYYNIVQLRQRLVWIQDAVAVDEERVAIASDKLQLGAGSGLDVLQARVDLNTDKSALLGIQNQLNDAVIQLNLLMAAPARELMVPADSIELMPSPSFDLLYAAMDTSNASLLLSRTDIELAELSLKDLRRKRYPVIGLNSAYVFNKLESESGFLKYSKSSGLNYGLSASLSLFNGSDLNRQISNARTSLDASQLRYTSFRATLDAELISNFDAYSNKSQAYQLEKSNLETARRNFKISAERYRLGGLSGFEYREAQTKLLQSYDRYITTRFEVRLLEIELMRLSGKLLPD